MEYAARRGRSYYCEPFLGNRRTYLNAQSRCPAKLENLFRFSRLDTVLRRALGRVALVPIKFKPRGFLKPQDQPLNIFELCHPLV